MIGNKRSVLLDEDSFVPARRVTVEESAVQRTRPGNVFRQDCKKLRVAQAPDFLLVLVGSAETHAAFLIESRTRGHVQSRVAGNPGPSRFLRRVGSTNLKKSACRAGKCAGRKPWYPPFARNAKDGAPRCKLISRCHRSVRLP